MFHSVEGFQRDTKSVEFWKTFEKLQSLVKRRKKLKNSISKALLLLLRTVFTDFF